jgi:hypothetical protein
MIKIFKSQRSALSFLEMLQHCWKKLYNSHIFVLDEFEG